MNCVLDPARANGARIRRAVGAAACPDRPLFLREFLAWDQPVRGARVDVRRVMVCSDRDPVGLVTALDFARYVAG